MVLKLICTLRAMLGMKRVHKWKRTKGDIVKTCRRCKTVVNVNKRVKP